MEQERTDEEYEFEWNGIPIPDWFVDEFELRDVYATPKRVRRIMFWFGALTGLIIGGVVFVVAAYYAAFS